MNPNIDPKNPSSSKPSGSTFSEDAGYLAEEAKERLQKAGEVVKDKAQAAASTVKDTLSSAGERIREVAGSVAERASDAMHSVSDGAANLYRKASDRVRTLGEDGVEFVRDNPVSTVLTALAAGVVLGYALRR